MSYETIAVERQEAAAILRFDRPRKRNALNLQALDELTHALRAADADAAVRGVILTGDREIFSAGADLNDALRVESVAECTGYFAKWHDLCQRLEELSKPCIAAIEGPCMTGGLELALACDLRVAGETASFAITSSRIGTVAGAGGTQRLPRIVGRANALEIMFSAEPISAQHAYRIGLTNRLVAPGEALAEALKMVAIYATRAPLSLALAKRAVLRGLDVDLSSGLELEKFLVTSIYGSRDRREGIAAFLEKRPPRFQGR